MKFRSNGKILLSGEYVVLKGAKALALPTKLGQTLSVETGTGFHWTSRDVNGEVWFTAEFDPQTLDIKSCSSDEIAARLQQMLRFALANATRSQDLEGKHFETQLDFARDWGLGSSSTLISCIAAVFGVDPFDLHFEVSNGSGYDIAAAITEGAVLYELNPEPTWFEVPFSPAFTDQLWFVHLGNKALSSEAVAKFNTGKEVSTTEIDNISSITNKMLICRDISDFNQLIVEHESLMSNILERETIKASLFSNYEGEVKSLGAWGGDFALATGDNNSIKYFEEKGYSTILPYNELILNA